MCIRDRAWGVERGARYELVSEYEVGMFIDLTWVLGTNFDAVSYTHLRAHETVLDLVCRLLLEKKNNETYQLRASKSVPTIYKKAILT